MGTPKKLTIIVGALAAAALLAGCASHATAQPTATTTVTEAPPTVTTTPSSASSPATSSTPSSTASAGTVAACATSSLSGAIEAGSGGAAGSVYVNLALTNTGTASCTLQGWPGVSFVGGDNGSQIGQAAGFNRATPHQTLTLTPSGKAVAELKITQAEVFPAADCGLVTADGFRVYPPGQKASLFVPYKVQACTHAAESLLEVSALR